MPKKSKLKKKKNFYWWHEYLFLILMPSYLEKVLNNEFQNIDVCRRCNKLSIQDELLSLVRVRRNSTTVFSRSLIWRSISNTKLHNWILGVFLHEDLTWKYFINFGWKQIAQSIGILFRTRFYLSCTTKLVLHYTLIYPYIACRTRTPRGCLLTYLT